MAVYRADYAQVFLKRYNTYMEEIIYRAGQNNFMDFEDIGIRIRNMMSYEQPNEDRWSSEYGQKLAWGDLRYVRQLFQGWMNLHILKIQNGSPLTRDQAYKTYYLELAAPPLEYNARQTYNKKFNKKVTQAEWLPTLVSIYHGYFNFLDKQHQDLVIYLEKREEDFRKYDETKGLLGFENQSADIGFFQAIQYVGIAALFSYVGYVAVSGAGAAAASESVGAAAASNTAAASTATVTTATSAGAAGGAATESGALLGQAGLLSGASAPVVETTLSLGSAATAVGSGSSTGALSTFLASTGSGVLTAAESAVGASIVNQVKNAINPKKTPESVTSAPVQAMPVTPVTNPVSSLPTNQILIAVAGAVGLALLLFI